MRDDLATLVGSRICHDLISPIGAIGNGVELLQLTGGGSGPEISLISESVQNANARIRFFRVAFGAASAEQIIGRKDVLAILSEMAQGGRMTYIWEAEGEHFRRHVRIAYLILLCMESAMPTGGNVTVQRDGDAWKMIGTASRLLFDEDLWASLTNPRTVLNVTPAQVQFALLPEVMNEAERALDVQITEQEIIVRF